MKTTNTTLTSQQINEIRALLFDSKPQEEILRIGDVMVDAEDLSTLAGERYISDFMIDTACLRYSEQPMQKIPIPCIIYTNLGFNQKCAISTSEVEALPFKNGSW